MSKISEQYEVSGDTLIRKNRFCPRCGEGTFMAEHSNRFSCGTCGYTEWKEGKDRIEPKAQPKPEPKEEKPEEEPKPEEAKAGEGEKPTEDAKEEKTEEKPAKESKDKSKKKKK